MTLEFKNMEVQGLRFSVELTVDDMGRPWEWSDGHGPVRSAHLGPKKPHERALSKYWMYDWKGALELAKKDSWGSSSLPVGLTASQELEHLVQQDFNYLKAWCDDDWCYSCVQVTLLKDSDYSETLGGVEYWHYKDNHYADSIASELAEDLAKQYVQEQSEKAYWESRDVVTVC